MSKSQFWSTPNHTHTQSVYAPWVAPYMWYASLKLCIAVAVVFFLLTFTFLLTLSANPRCRKCKKQKFRKKKQKRLSVCSCLFMVFVGFTFTTLGERARVWVESFYLHCVCTHVPYARKSRELVWMHNQFDLKCKTKMEWQHYFFIHIFFPVIFIIFIITSELPATACWRRIFFPHGLRDVTANQIMLLPNHICYTDRHTNAHPILLFAVLIPLRTPINFHSFYRRRLSLLYELHVISIFFRESRHHRQRVESTSHVHLTYGCVCANCAHSYTLQ